MKTHKILLVLSVAVLCFCMAGCSVSTSGSTHLVAGGAAVLEGDSPLVVQAAQPALPEAPPPPPPKPKAKLVGKKIVITEKVLFEIDKAAIRAESNDLLTQVGDIIKKFPTIKKVSIEGHTDSDGSDVYNKKLSQKRANAVKEFLVNLGIEKDRLTAVGHGEGKPIASNDSAVGKEKNRRVEFNIVEGEAVEMVKPNDQV